MMNRLQERVCQILCLQASADSRAAMRVVAFIDGTVVLVQRATGRLHRA